MSDDPQIFREPGPDDERRVDLDDAAEFELPPPTLDPDERIEDDTDPTADDELDEVRGVGDGPL